MYLTWYTGSRLTAIASGVLGAYVGAFGHNWVHQPKYKDWGWGILSLDFLGFSSECWFRDHVLQHHMWVTPSLKVVMEPRIVTGPHPFLTWRLHLSLDGSQVHKHTLGQSLSRNRSLSCHGPFSKTKLRPAEHHTLPVSFGDVFWRLRQLYCPFNLATAGAGSAKHWKNGFSFVALPVLFSMGPWRIVALLHN